MNTVWILVPCFNDSESFAEFRRRIALLEPEFEHIFTFKTVVIDDTAGTDKNLASLTAEPFTVITPDDHLGHQGALVFGLRSLSEEFCDTDFIVTMDCDGEDRPEDIPALLANLQSRQEDLSAVCVAERRRRHGPLWFKSCVVAFQFAYIIFTGVRIRHGNFIAMRGALVKQVLSHPNFNMCYSTSIVSVAGNHQAVILDRGKRYCGDSKMTFATLAAHGLAMTMPYSRQLLGRSILITAFAFAICFIMSIFLPVRIEHQQTILLCTPLVLAIVILATSLTVNLKAIQTRASTIDTMVPGLGANQE